MIQPVRSVMTGLFVLSLFSLASCNRNWCGDCFTSPCEIFSCNTNDCRSSCDTGCKPSNCPKPCPPEENPFFPYDPCGVSPCGAGGCNDQSASVEKCYGRMQSYKTCDDCVVDL